MKKVQLTIGESTNRQSNSSKTTAQTLQRILVKVVGIAYAMLKFICNHSFEGFSNGRKCANRFRSINLRYLRERAATLQSSGQSLSQFYQFMPIQSDKWSPFAAIISQGHLPEVSVGIDAEGGHKAYVNSPGRTYADFIKAWGLQRKDQLTFVTVQKLQGKYDVNYARIVLNPRNPDSSGAPMTTEIVNSQGEFPCSNWKNRLNFSTFEFDTDHYNFVLGHGGIVVAAGIIVSRKDKSGDWFRSNCQLVLNEAGFGSDLCSLATAPLNSIAVSGMNLGDVTFTAKVDGTGDAINPTSHDANGASFTGLNVAAGHSLVVYHGSTIWFTVTVVEGGSDVPGGDE